MDRLRREAFKRFSDDWGVPPADKKDVALGCVARTDSANHLSYAIVLKGEIDPARIRAKLVDQHVKAAKRRGVATSPEDITVDGHAATRVPYLQREMEFTLVPLDHIFVACASPKGDQTLLHEVLEALKDPDKLGQAPLGEVQVEGHFKLNDGEKQRVQTFEKKQVGAVAKVREKFRQLQDKLRPGGAKDEDLQSLDEQLTAQFLKAVDFELKLNYVPSPTELYRGKYVLIFATPDDATKMRELLLEKALFFKDNASNPGIPRALDTVTVDAQDQYCVVRAELDTPEKRYDALFSYVAFLLSFSGADRFLDVNRGQ